MLAALTGTKDLKSLCGVGASTNRDGVNDAAVAKKVTIIDEAMRYHETTQFLGKPLLALQKVGGTEIAALVGGMLECSEKDIPVLVDGFMVTTAAMIACQMDPTVTKLLIFATQSTEKGQTVALNEIGGIARLNNIPAPVMPALNMQLRMGEATGALLAIPLVKSACAVVSDLATLNEVLGLAS